MLDCTPIQHRILGPGDIHGIANYVFATEQNRIDFSGPVTDTDRHKVAFVTESQQYYVLIGTDPIQWGSFSVPFPSQLSYDDVQRNLILTLSNSSSLSTSLAAIYTYADQVASDEADDAQQSAIIAANQYTDTQITTVNQSISNLTDIVNGLSSGIYGTVIPVSASFVYDGDSASSSFRSDAATAITITLPTWDNIPETAPYLNHTILVQKYGTGDIDFAAQAGVTFETILPANTLTQQYGWVALVLTSFDQNTNDTTWAIIPIGTELPTVIHEGDAVSLLTNDAGYLDSVSATNQIANDIVTEPKLSPEVRTKLNNSAPNNYNATTDPTVNDDASAGWENGSVWINTTIPESYRCLDNTNGAAVWIETTLTTDELATVATTGNYSDLNGLPILGTAAAADTGDFATAAQGAKADTALQPNDNISELTNDAGYVDAAGASSAAPVQDVFGRTGNVAAAYGDYEIADIAPTTDVLVNASQNLDNTWHNIWVRVTAAADITVPASGVWNIPGAIIHFIKMTPGTVQFVEDTGVTIRSVGGLEILRENGVVTLKNLAADTWIVVGDV